MEYRKLGNSGLQVSVVGLGCMNFGMMNDAAEAAAIVRRALELGVNFFDTADVYGNRGTSEEYLGRALGARRAEVVIATKFAGPMSADKTWMQGGSRRWLMQAVEGSLRRLGTDYIDLYQMHRADEAVPIEETLRTLDDLVRQGKVRYIGCSNFAAWQVADAAWTARVHHLEGFISAQNRYSLLSRDLERELAPAARAFGLGIIPYFPLESGLLSGKYRPGSDFPAGSRLAKWGEWAAGAFASPERLAQLGRLLALCERHDHTLLELAMGWLAAQPTVSSIIAGVT
ncbi:MAG: aldo/keto reductase, partial [Gammaproteobacteria bacterium]|nr:aldo/keto reductase [Gammaproteobacteria bacterium]